MSEEVGVFRREHGRLTDASSVPGQTNLTSCRAKIPPGATCGRSFAWGSHRKSKSQRGVVRFLPSLSLPIRLAEWPVRPIF